MIAIPALDLREGACVQLVGGNYDAERIRWQDPIAVLRTWEASGFSRAHVVDLDAATGKGTNVSVVASLLHATALTLQVGGGVRTDAAAQSLFSLGARYVVVGTRALEDPEWLVGLVGAHPRSVIVAVDARGRDVVCAGWTRALSRHVLDVIAELNALPLAGILVTAVHVEGQMRGPDLALAECVARASAVPTYAAGGIATLGDLSALAERGVTGAIVGMALYTGALNACTVAREFAA